MTRKRLSVSLSDKMAERLDESISKSGLSESEIVRAALNDYFKKEGGKNE